MNGISIVGTGSYLPERVVENTEFSGFLDTSDEWIRSHTGIERRHVALEEPVWHMGAQAAKRALEAAGITPQQVDMIVGTTVTADYRYPSMACLIQDAIGAEKAFCFDIGAACAGAAYAIDIAWRYLSTGGAEYALVVCSEALTQTTDFTDRSNCILFGDGAGAFVVTKGGGMYSAFLHSDGAGAKHLFAKHPRMKTPFHREGDAPFQNPFETKDNGFTVMNGHDVYRFATRAMPRAVREACGKAGIRPDDLDLVIPHQANLRIIEAAVKYMKLPMEKVYVNIHNTGNMSSASTAVCLDECVRSGRIRRGDKVCLVGFGAGLVYGAAVFEY